MYFSFCFTTIFYNFFFNIFLKINVFPLSACQTITSPEIGFTAPKEA